MNESQIDPRIVLEVRDLSKRYPGVVALDRVSLHVKRHEVIGLAGENGAGKSTLLKALVGLVQPDSGTIAVRGTPVQVQNVADAARHGIGMVFQEQSLVPNISAAENILLGCEGRAVRAGIFRTRTLRRLAQAQLDKIGCTVDPGARTETLTFAERQMVEIAKVLGIEERTSVEPIILLDEPTSVLEPEEVEILFGQIQRLREHASVIFVSHRLDEVMRVSDRVYVLRGGQVAGEVDPSRAVPSQLHELMIGTADTGNHYHEDLQARTPPDRPRMVVNSLSGDGFRDVSIDVRQGEIVAIAGVHGSGREDLCRALFGAGQIISGEVTLDGSSLSLTSPRSAVAAGIGYVPAERKVEGMVPVLSVAQNMTLARTELVCRGPLLDHRREAQLVDAWIERLNIRTPSRSTGLGRLSGGNQQKVVLARWLLGDGLKVLLLDHPTRGLDVGAKSEVYLLMRNLANSGVAILLLADSLEEAIAMSDRVFVMNDGEVVSCVPSPPGAKPEPIEIVREMV